MLKLHNLNEPYTGGLGSFALFILTLFTYNTCGNDKIAQDDLLQLVLLTVANLET